MKQWFEYFNAINKELAGVFEVCSEALDVICCPDMFLSIPCREGLQAAVVKCVHLMDGYRVCVNHWLEGLNNHPVNRQLNDFEFARTRLAIFEINSHISGIRDQKALVNSELAKSDINEEDRLSANRILDALWGIYTSAQPILNATIKDYNERYDQDLPLVDSIE